MGGSERVALLGVAQEGVACEVEKRRVGPEGAILEEAEASEEEAEKEEAFLREKECSAEQSKNLKCLPVEVAEHQVGQAQALSRVRPVLQLMTDDPENDPNGWSFVCRTE